MLSRRHIKAPKSYDPGKGRPREHLAYLNKQEMMALELMNGGNRERGPKGLPSFVAPPSSSLGVSSGKTTSSSYSSSGKMGASSSQSGGVKSSAPVGTNPNGGGGGQKSGNSSNSTKSSTGLGGSKSSTSQTKSSTASKTSSAAKSSTSSKMGASSTQSGGTKASAAKSAPAKSSSPVGTNSGGGGGQKTSGPAASMAAAKASAAKSAPKASAPPGIGASKGGGGGSNTKMGAKSSQSGGTKAPTASAVAKPSKMGAGSSQSGGGFKAPTAPKAPASGKMGAGSSQTQKTTGPLSAKQKAAYSQYGAARNSAPKAAAVTRSEGDAYKMAKMARAESATIKDETGNMNPAGAQAVMHAIRNRMVNQDRDVEGIITQPKQFSPLNDSGVLYKNAKPTAAEVALAEQVLQGNVVDITKGADFYHNADTVRNKPGYSKADTKNRIKNDFTETYHVADVKSPGKVSHSFGIASQPAADVTRKGAPMRGPTSLPRGAIGGDENDIGRDTFGVMDTSKTSYAKSPVASSKLANPASSFGLGGGITAPPSVSSRPAARTQEVNRAGKTGIQTATTADQKTSLPQRAAAAFADQGVRKSVTPYNGIPKPDSMINDFGWTAPPKPTARPEGFKSVAGMSFNPDLPAPMPPGPPPRNVSQYSGYGSWPSGEERELGVEDVGFGNPRTVNPHQPAPHFNDQMARPANPYQPGAPQNVSEYSGYGSFTPPPPGVRVVSGPPQSEYSGYGDFNPPPRTLTSRVGPDGTLQTYYKDNPPRDQVAAPAAPSALPGIAGQFGTHLNKLMTGQYQIPSIPRVVSPEQAAQLKRYVDNKDGFLTGPIAQRAFEKEAGPMAQRAVQAGLNKVGEWQGDLRTAMAAPPPASTPPPNGGVQYADTTPGGKMYYDRVGPDGEIAGPRPAAPVQQAEVEQADPTQPAAPQAPTAPQQVSLPPSQQPAAPGQIPGSPFSRFPESSNGNSDRHPLEPPPGYPPLSGKIVQGTDEMPPLPVEAYYDPNLMAYYMEVMSNEEVMNQLLGEEWYA